MQKTLLVATVVLGAACANRATHRPLSISANAQRADYQESLKQNNLCRVSATRARDTFTACNNEGRTKLNIAAVRFGEPKVVVIHKENRIVRAQRLEMYESIDRGKERFRLLHSSMEARYGTPNNDIATGLDRPHTVSRAAWLEPGNGARIITLLNDPSNHVIVVEDFFPLEAR